MQWVIDGTHGSIDDVVNESKAVGFGVQMIVSAGEAMLMNLPGPSEP